MGLCAAELRASGPCAQCWAHLQTGHELPWHAMALLGPLGPPKGLGLLRRALQRRCAAERWACPGLSVNFYPFARGVWVQGRGRRAASPGPLAWEGGMELRCSQTSPSLCRVCWAPGVPSTMGACPVWGPGAVVEGAPGKEWTLGLLCLTPCPPGVVSWGCALLHTPCAVGAGGCALRPWQFGGTLQQ